MRRWLWMIFFPLWLAAMTLPAWAALQVPRLQGRVNDQAHLLTPEQAASLEEQLRAYEEKTTNQIALLTLPSLEGESLEEFSIKVGREWQLGQAKRNNGVLLLIAAKERAVRIEVGYGLEGALTDAQSSIIIRNIIVPAFRQGDFDRGIRDGVGAIEKAIAGEFTPPPAERPSRPRGNSNELFSLGLIFIILFSSFLSYLPLYVTGIVGAILGGVIGAFLIGSVLLSAGVGFVVGIILSILFRGSGGGPGRGLGGRMYRGTGWSSGGSGGGFSGGGGSFGGGGASGKW